MTPAAFMRAFPLRAVTLCSEPVVAWAHLRGCAPVARLTQMRLWRKHGCAIGAEIVADRMGLVEISPIEARPGDAALFDMRAGEPVLGLCAGEFSIVAAFGKIHVGRFVAARAWRI